MNFIKQSRYKRTIITSIVVLLILAILIPIVATYENWYTTKIEGTKHITYKYDISDDKINIKIKANANIKNLSFDVLFLSKITNTQYEVDKKIDIDKNQTKNIVFDLGKIKSELKGFKPTNIKLTHVKYYIQNNIDKELKDEITGYFTIAVIVMAVSVIIAWARDRAKIEDAEELRRWEEKQRRTEEEYEAEKQRRAEEQRKNEERQKAKEEQRRRAQAQREFEEERLRKIKCRICGESSFGDPICHNCIERSKILSQEINSSRLNSYDNIHKYRQELMLSAINTENQIAKEAACLRLVALAELLETKYKEHAKKGIFEFFSDLNNIQDKETLLKKYQLHEEQTPEKSENGSKEYEAKKLKCLDGDIVKSKAEREIDNFFFNNKIWHIYEYSYRHPITHELSRPDFYLPNYNLFIEYFGLNSEKYLKNREHKIKMYRSDDTINFEYLTYEDDDRLYDKLKDICQKYKIPLK